MFDILNSKYVFMAIIAIIAVLVIILALTIYLKFKGRKNEVGSYKRKQFLTKNEQDCFRHLMKEFPDYLISVQVSMGAILEPIIDSYSHDASVRSQAAVLRNKIGSKIVDFVLINKSTLNIWFIIELDDKSHDNKINEDAERDRNLALAGIYSVRFRRENGGFPGRAKIESVLRDNIKVYQE